MANIPLGHTSLLLFAFGQTGEDIRSEAGVIPHHGPTSDILDLLQRQGNGAGNLLKQHFCFAVEKPEDVDNWEQRLREKGVNILSTMSWQKGGKSVYFTDEDGNIGEVGSKGIWPHW
jgi:catechol 2,3-dioxygenase-like lactoylglutathione lyase family enzyme